MLKGDGGRVNPVIGKFERFVRLSPAEHQAIEALAGLPTHRVPARQDLVREGDRPTSVFVILDGWACRWKSLADGRRQILSLLLPGDFCDLHGFLYQEMDHSLGALSRVRAVEIPRQAFARLLASSERINQAMWWSELTSAAIQREWTINLGQRSAFERIAHLLCETFTRLDAIGLTRDGSCEFPLVQQDLADATGLTAVHVNRTLQELRRRGLIRLAERRATILDRPALEELAEFDAAYLYLEVRRR